MVSGAVQLLAVDKTDPRLIASQKAYFEEISERFGVAFDPYAGEKEGSDEAAQWHVIALEDKAVLGCGSLRDLGGGFGEVKRVWVSDTARGKGVATALMDWLEMCAHDKGFSTIRLDTNGSLVEAQALYAKRGYSEIARYNNNPFAEHFYEKRITSPETR